MLALLLRLIVGQRLPEHAAAAAAEALAALVTAAPPDHGRTAFLPVFLSGAPELIYSPVHYKRTASASFMSSGDCHLCSKWQQIGAASPLASPLAGALQKVATGSEVERAAVPALLNDLLADQASADALQKSLAMEDTGSPTQTQVC